MRYECNHDVRQQIACNVLPDVHVQCTCADCLSLKERVFNLVGI